MTRPVTMEEILMLADAAAKATWVSAMVDLRRAQAVIDAFGYRVRIARLRQGPTQQQLAARAPPGSGDATRKTGAGCPKRVLIPRLS